MNYFDWDKCKQFVKDRKPISVDAGLLDDWFWTAAEIYKDGQFIPDHHAYLKSTWAIPGFKAVMENGDCIEVVCCKSNEDTDD